jgi:prostaglandin-H2 D-isomerase / glutathione transferase
MVKYDLYYLNLRARGEIARLLFAAAGVEYTDHRYEFAEFDQLKAQSPLGAAPYLEVDGVKLPQSLSIGRFLAREFNLDGKTSLEKAYADVIVDTIIDIINPLGALIFKTPDGPEKVKFK